MIPGIASRFPAAPRMRAIGAGYHEHRQCRRVNGISSYCEGLKWAGLKIDAARNQQMVAREGLISTDDSKLLAYAIPTDEELLIARDTVRVILGQPHPS